MAAAASRDPLHAHISVDENIINNTECDDGTAQLADTSVASADGTASSAVASRNVPMSIFLTMLQGIVANRPCRTSYRIIFVPRGHPLTRCRRQLMGDASHDEHRDQCIAKDVCPECDLALIPRDKSARAPKCWSRCIVCNLRAPRVIVCSCCNGSAVCPSCVLAARARVSTPGRGPSSSGRVSREVVRVQRGGARSQGSGECPLAMLW